jgi:predicted lipid-binding transport protein (Tim44 family)
LEHVMKFLSVILATLALSLTLTPFDAEAARRLGGGKSMGMQRQAQPATPPAAAPTSAAKPAAAPGAAAPAAAAGKRSWMGPLAGLAAGLGLAALASHFGFGDELASMMMMAMLAFAVIAVIGFVMRKRAMANGGANGMQYAGAQSGAQHSTMPRSALPTQLAGGSSVAATPAAATPAAATPAAATSPARIPADFDVAGFARNAKVNFIRLQAANDAGNLDDIREFTSPEMFAEISMDIAERKGAVQSTDVMAIEADVIEVAEEANRYVVSVRFTGTVREEDDAQPQSINEVWHMTKPRNGNSGWVLAGIQQA